MSSYVPMKLAYEVAEPEKRVNLNDIIFIHGLSNSNTTWRKLTKKFADCTGRRAYALDMRNHGESEWSEDFNYDIQAKDILHFMDEKGIKQAVLIGHSMGAKISMKLALAQQERVEKIVLEDLSPEITSEGRRLMAAENLAVLTKAIEAVPPAASYQDAKKIILDFISDNLPEDLLEKANLSKPKPELFELSLTKREGRYAAKCNLEVLQKWIRNGAFSPCEGLCTKPALFIYGTLSPYEVNKDEDLIMKLFPNAKLHAIEGAGHNIHGEFPEEFSQVVLKFVSEA